MIPFYLAVAALVVVALILLLRPWWPGSRRIASADFSPELNAAIHRDRLAELERDRSNGSLSESDLTEAREELQRQLLDDTAAVEAVAADRFGGRAGVAVAILLPLAAVALYALLGSPAAVLPVDVQIQKAAGDMEQLTAKLAKRLEDKPDNPQGWLMLGRSYKSLGRWDDAERAFARIGPELNKNAEWLAELAELLIQKNNGYNEQARQLIRQALQLEPGNMLALFMAGGDAFSGERFAEAIAHWERLLPQLEPGGEDARMVESAMAKARQRGGLAPKIAAANKGAPQSTAKTAKGTAIAAGKSVSGRVELSPALKDKAMPDDVVFIFARAINGPRMPLAALRVRVADLPLDFMLDDTKAVMPSATISSVEELRVEARVSKSGKATPGKGDLTGKSPTVKPGAKGLRIVIDTINP
ncbi:MAG: c-type cytochrome biogenesis protein CcmI [Sulfuritalea sp.]|nr:c-type cytochrome biogenesis protein CcmI [Sulfuritalea sp.]